MAYRGLTLTDETQFDQLANHILSQLEKDRLEFHRLQITLSSFSKVTGRVQKASRPRDKESHKL